MKNVILIAAGFGVIVALGATMTCLNRAAASRATEAAASAARESKASQPNATLMPALAPATSKSNSANRLAPKSFSPPATAATGAEREIRQAIETLLSPQSTFAEKQAVWKQLISSGRLDEAIAELEKRLAANPDSWADSATLGEAYLQKCGQINDIRQHGILAMKADQLFDAALTQNPSDWDAQFYKTSAMSHWPLELNLGPKVAQQFQTLIQEQESQPAQPEFALTYLRLGDFYQKTGDANGAAQVWQQGAALFPGNTDLQGQALADASPMRNGVNTNFKLHTPPLFSIL